MGKFKPVSKRNGRDKGISVTIGVDGRMYLSSGFKKILNHDGKKNYYLFYDDSERRIGISKETPDSNVEAFSFSATGECKVVSFIEDCEIHMPGKPVLWLYEGNEKGIYAFYQQGRSHIALRQEKNGNLERLK
ncbi:hypothetical protein [Paenibacillus pinihumi]|uniref:hypothetical protein n=1 Tax=Paenibacillus pinihumi TaxID=669462 RepID=UPI00048DFC2B|nr:hypothetical protein [Paenibacillus pinihumi]